LDKKKSLLIGSNFYVPVQNKNNIKFCDIFCGYKKGSGETKNFLPSSFVAIVGSGIPDPIKKSRIRNTTQMVHTKCDIISGRFRANFHIIRYKKSAVRCFKSGSGSDSDKIGSLHSDPDPGSKKIRVPIKKKTEEIKSSDLPDVLLEG
jgi:hypothetical protein